MRLPRLPFGIQHAQPQIVRFLGLNLTPNTQEGEFADMRGISTSNYPLITPRNQRQQYTSFTDVQDVYVWNKTRYVFDKVGAGDVKIKKGNTDTTTTIGTLSIEGKKSVAVINSKMVIYPDKVYVDLTNNTVTSLVTINTSYDTWNLITSNNPDDPNYTIHATGIGTAIPNGSVVDLSATNFSGSRVVVRANPEVSEDDVYILKSSVQASGAISGALTVKTSIPDLDFICSSGNRIWGCNNSDNTIYASALGDPTDFFKYASGDIGPYAVTVGSSGNFTGICEFDNAVCVWKEKILHKILGGVPSEFYMNDSTIDGVQEGSERSLTVINNTLYYKGVNGIYTYAGGRPQSVSYNLGNGIFTNGVGGTDGNKYYINMTNPAGVTHLYAYDLKHNLWSIEGLDGEDPYTAMANTDGTLYMVYAHTTTTGGVTTTTGKLRHLTNDAPLSTVQWYAEFVPFYENTLNRKGYLRLLIRMEMTTGSSVTVKVKEDNQTWKTAWTQTAKNNVPVLVPLRLGRCDKFTLRIEGIGDVAIRTVGREYVGGSVIN